MTNFRPFLLPLMAAVVVLAVAGWAGSKAKGDTEYVARDVNTLYGMAKQRLDGGAYEEAGKMFDEVERQHPYSVWARLLFRPDCRRRP